MKDRRFLSLSEQVNLAGWLKTLPLNTPRSLQSLVDEAAEKLEIPGLTIAHIRRISKELEIPLPPNLRGAGTPSSVPKAAFDSLSTRVAALEEELRLLKSFYINTTKEPRPPKEKKGNSSAISSKEAH